LKLVIFTGVLLVVNDIKTPPDPLFEVRFACKVMAVESKLKQKQKRNKSSSEKFFIRIILKCELIDYSERNICSVIY